MKNITKTLLVAAVLTIQFSCKKNSETPAAAETPTPPLATNLVKIGETYIIGAKAKATVYASKAFETGYNEVFVSLTDSADGSTLSRGHFDINPMMDMGTMKHSAPVENTEDTVSTNGYFKSAVVFIMSGTSSEWALNMTFHNHKNGLTGQGSLGVNVSASSPTKLLSTVLALDSGKKVFISLIQPSKPQVGINDFEIAIHQKASMMNYPAVDNYSVAIEPEMPSMDHGSPNNVDPVNKGKGHYSGKVNYTMTGLWYVHLKLYKNGVLVSDDQHFEMTLQ